MISVESRNGRKSLGVGFGSARDMEETELEEGEAYDYRDYRCLNGDDENIDPDVDLSYLDEKVQVLLGDFQKDFEGGVSAENLGAKFGGYGSFLPTYQRSPSIWSQPRTPQKVQSSETPNSSNNLPVEGEFQNSAFPPGANFSSKHPTTSTSAAPPLTLRAPLLESSSKKKSALLSSKQTLACNSNNEPLSRPNNLTDQKTLKVRLKVGSDNMAQKTAAIFSDLGFQLSSPDESPVESGGFSQESRGSPDESPTRILQIMTSSPVSKGLLLSPLPDSLLHLTEKDKVLRDSRSGSACRGSQGSTSILLEESTSVLGEGKPREKKPQPVENNNKLIEKKNEIVKNIGNGFGSLPNEKLDKDNSERKEYVADPPNLPPFSNSKFRVGETAKGTSQGFEVSDIRKFKMGQTSFSDSGKEDLESMKSRDVNTTKKLKPKDSSRDKVLENRKEKVHKDVQSLSGKDGHKSKSNEICDSGNPDYDGLKVKRELNGGTMEPPENKLKLKVTSLERGGNLPCGREQTLSEGKKKSKGSKSNGNPAATLSHESSRVAPSTSKDHRKSSRDSSSKNKFDDSKLPREFNKTRETYKDIFGDEEMEQAENSMDTPFRNRSKGNKPEMIEKQTRQFSDKSKDKSSGQETQFADKSIARPNSKKVENPLTSESHQKAAQNVASERNGLAPDTVAPTVAPVVIEENWVACDRCQKWRLLPYGINPTDLPKEWRCKMSYWLPKMNRCSISEEETNKAVANLNQSVFLIPAPEIQNNLQAQPTGAAAGVILPEVQNLNLKHQDHNFLSLPSGGNKKHGLKESADATNCVGPGYTSNSINKNQQASLKSRSVSDANQSPLDSNLENKVGIRYLSKSSDSTGEKRRHKTKDKHKLAQDGGATNHSKIKSKREADQDVSKVSKKIKTESCSNEEWNSDHVGAMRSSSLTASHCLSAKTDVRGTKKHGEYSSSKESKFDTKDNPPAFSKKPKELVQPLGAGALDVGKLDNRDIAAKKRKVKEWQESQTYQLQPLTDASHHFEASVSLDGTSGSELRKSKKSRISKSEGKGSHKSFGDAREDKRDRAPQIQISGSRDFVVDEMVEGKGYVDKDQQHSQYQRGNMMSQKMLDSMDALKKDSGYGFPSLAATSSSSKVSGSRKSKANFQDTKGSPVESVSSSPMRIPDKGTSARRIVLSKDDAVTVGLSTNGSLRRCSDGEGDGGEGHSGSTRKEKTHSVYRGSLESNVHDYQDRDMNPTSGENSKALNEPYQVGFSNPHLVNGGSNTLDQCGKHMEQVKEHDYDDEQMNKHYGPSGCLSRKSGKGSSSRAKDKQKDSSSDVDKGKLKVSDSVNNQEGLPPTKSSRNEADLDPHESFHSREGPMGGKYTSQEKHGVKGDKDKKSCLGKKEYLGKWSNDGIRETRSISEGNLGTDVKFSAASSKDGKSNGQQSSLQDHVGEKFSRHSLSDRPDHDQLETTSRRGKSQSFQHSGDKQETQTRCPRPMSSNHKSNGADLLRGDASRAGADELKIAKLSRKSDSQAGAAHNSLRHSTPGRVVAGDLEGPSPVRKDSSFHAANTALREARDLKHSADRLKNSGSGLESTGLYFEAVLKFLHGASLLEPSNVESSRHGESQSVHVYSTTTSLCEFVAQEYERCKEMAFAALAYKCLEVACMRVVYFKHWSVNRDRHDLQTALHMVPPGESPSSSASDVDNLNNQGAMDKVPLAKGVGSPHVVGNHVIAARNRPNFVRVLNFTQDVNSAMEASRKSLNAFAAASASLEESQYEGISSVKRALDFSFNDVQGLLRLVRVAMEAISS